MTASEATPEVIIKRRVTAEGHPFSELFINYQGQRFYSRNWWTIPDTPQSRASEAQQFLKRRSRP